MSKLSFDPRMNASAPKPKEEQFEPQMLPVTRKSVPVFGDMVDAGTSLMKALYRSSKADSTAAPNLTGVLEHPFDMGLANKMPNMSTYHGACQRTLVAAICGAGVGIIDEAATEKRRKMQEELGEVDSASLLPVIDEAATRVFYDFFDGITEHGFDTVLNQMTGNVCGIGNGYMELKRALANKRPMGLWWTPGHQVWKVQLDALDSSAYCWKYNPYDDYAHDATGCTYLRKHLDNDRSFENLGVSGITPENVSQNELLDFQLPTTLWRHYGAPNWLAAVPVIEVGWRALQRVSDYMHNNGVPESLVVIGGVKLTPDQFAGVVSTLSGGGGQHYGKGGVLNFPHGTKDRVVFQVHQLAQSLEGSGWSETNSDVNLSVASANQVPPVLAGITVPGKMAASNEQVLAMVVLQNTVVGPIQKYLAQRMSRCLLSRECGAPAGLAGRRLRLRTMLEVSDIVALNTVARQREQVAETPDRETDEGLKRG